MNVSPSSEESDSLQLEVACSKVLEDVHLGDSIAVNGVCLTVTSFSDATFTADVMKTTLDATTIGTLSVEQRVNLERAMAAHSRFGGHIVQGHVDGRATLISRRPSYTAEGNVQWEVFRFGLHNPELGRYMVTKGSICINGTSLTISDMDITPDKGKGEPDGVIFEVSLIPTTLSDTMLRFLDEGDEVNIEVDILAKYVAKQMPS